VETNSARRYRVGSLLVGLGAFAAFYFSTTIVSDSKTYGTIGVTFTLVTWFIAIGAVITLGTVMGAAWQRRMTAKHLQVVSDKPEAKSDYSEPAFSVARNFNSSAEDGTVS
jgi:uncharacterized BrkB/YihY/UPF0761 family membrane protein